jgi:hypothetical protein
VCFLVPELALLVCLNPQLLLVFNSIFVIAKVSMTVPSDQSRFVMMLAEVEEDSFNTKGLGFHRRNTGALTVISIDTEYQDLIACTNKTKDMMMIRMALVDSLSSKHSLRQSRRSWRLLAWLL